MSRGLAYALGAIAVWSTNAFAGGAALEHLTVLQVLTLQFAGALAVLLVVRGWGGLSKLVPRRPRVAAIGITGLTLTMSLQYLAFAWAPLVGANAVAYAWPLLVAVWVFARGDANGWAPTLAVVGLGGVVLLFVEGRPAGPADHPILGYAAALASAFAMAFYTVAVGRLERAAQPAAMTTGVFAGLLLVGPAALLAGGSWEPVTAALAALYVGAGPTALGYGLWTRAMSGPRAGTIAPLAYLTPLLSTLVLVAAGQTLGGSAALGCALVVLCGLGVGLNTRRPRDGEILGRDAPQVSYR